MRAKVLELADVEGMTSQEAREYLSAIGILYRLSLVPTFGYLAGRNTLSLEQIDFIRRKRRRDLARARGVQPRYLNGLGKLDQYHPLQLSKLMISIGMLRTGTEYQLSLS